MKKSLAVLPVPRAEQIPAPKPETTIGLDLGDRWSHYCVLDVAGGILQEGRIRTTALGVEERFAQLPPTRIVMEAGTHSPWVSRQLQGYGHKVIVANARKVRLIYESDRKNDRLDARMLAKLGRVDVSLLSPIQHRSAQAQMDLAVIRSRDALVAARTQLINAARGLVKAVGGRLPAATSAAFARKITTAIPGAMKPALTPLLKTIQELSEQIRGYDVRVEELARCKYPQTTLLMQVKGVGPLTALTFVLTLEDPHRFAKSRSVGCFLGLGPQQSQSGQSAPQLGITKGGDRYLRRLLVQCAHYVLGPFGMDTNLRRWGLKLAQGGGKSKKNELWWR
jgi:transposase